MKTQLVIDRAMRDLQLTKRREERALLSRINSLKDNFLSRVETLEQRFMQEVETYKSQLHEQIHREKEKSNVAIQKEANDLQNVLRFYVDSETRVSSISCASQESATSEVIMCPLNERQDRDFDPCLEGRGYRDHLQAHHNFVYHESPIERTRRKLQHLEEKLASYSTKSIRRAERVLGKKRVDSKE